MLIPLWIGVVFTAGLFIDQFSAYRLEPASTPRRIYSKQTSGQVPVISHEQRQEQIMTYKAHMAGINTTICNL